VGGRRAEKEIRRIGRNTLTPFAQTRNEKKPGNTAISVDAESAQIRRHGLFQLING
jgi:hypothetical protein